MEAPVAEVPEGEGRRRRRRRRRRGGGPAQVRRVITDKRVLTVMALAFAQTVFVVNVFSFAPFFVDWMLEEQGVDATVDLTNYYTGLLLSAAPLGIFMSSTLWGALADRIGRRMSLVIGVFCCTVGSYPFGMIPSVWMAIFVQFVLGLLNGNWGIMCTYLEEILPDQKRKNEGFSYLMMCYGLGSVIGPCMGGFLSDPCSKYSFMEDWGFFQRYPYELPYLVNGTMNLFAFICILLWLDESLPTDRITCGTGSVWDVCCCLNWCGGWRAQAQGYAAIDDATDRQFDADYHEWVIVNVRREEESDARKADVEAVTGEPASVQMIDVSRCTPRVVADSRSVAFAADRGEDKEDKEEEDAGAAKNRAASNVSSALSGEGDGGDDADDEVEEDNTDDKSQKNLDKKSKAAKGQMSAAADDGEIVKYFDDESGQMVAVKQKGDAFADDSVVPVIGSVQGGGDEEEDVERVNDDVLLGLSRAEAAEDLMTDKSGAVKVGSSEIAGESRTEEPEIGKSKAGSIQKKKKTTSSFAKKKSSKKTRRGKKKGPSTGSGSMSRDIWDLLWIKDYSLPVFIFCVSSFMFSSYEAVYPLWAKVPCSDGGIGWNTNQIGLVFMVCGIMLTATSSSLYPMFANWIGPILIVRYALLVDFVVLFAMYPYWLDGDTRDPNMSAKECQQLGAEMMPGVMVANVLLAVFTGSLFTSVTILQQIGISRTRPDLLGLSNGFAQSVVCVMRTIAPIVAQALFSEGLTLEAKESDATASFLKAFQLKDLVYYFYGVVCFLGLLSTFALDPKMLLPPKKKKTKSSKSKIRRKQKGKSHAKVADASLVAAKKKGSGIEAETSAMTGASGGKAAPAEVTGGIQVVVAAAGSSAEEDNESEFEESESDDEFSEDLHNIYGSAVIMSSAIGYTPVAVMMSISPFFSHQQLREDNNGRRTHGAHTILHSGGTPALKAISEDFEMEQAKRSAAFLAKSTTVAAEENASLLKSPRDLSKPYGAV